MAGLTSTWNREVERVEGGKSSRGEKFFAPTPAFLSPDTCHLDFTFDFRL
jgi:hypothetical protein